MKINPVIKVQLTQCIDLLNNVFGKDLLGVYLFGSAVIGGLQKYSDIDLLVVSNRSTTYKEKARLVASLLNVSGDYQRNSKPPIELTIVVKSEINPWVYPPKFDFQYGDWLREEFSSENIEPWASKEMPDLAVLITQVLLANKILLGPEADKLICKIPYKDFLRATNESLNGLMADLHHDTRNVLLTYARIWKTLETDTICSKPDAGLWAIKRLPEEFKPVMIRARAICMGEEKEYWSDLQALTQPCAEYMVDQINARVALIESSDHANKTIKLAE